MKFLIRAGAKKKGGKPVETPQLMQFSCAKINKQIHTNTPTPSVPNENARARIQFVEKKMVLDEWLGRGFTWHRVQCIGLGYGLAGCLFT